MQLYLVGFVPLRLRFIIAIGDVTEAVDALIKSNAEAQAFSGSPAPRMPSSDAPHCHLLTPRADSAKDQGHAQSRC